MPNIVPRAEINLPPNLPPRVEPRAEEVLPPELPPIVEPRAEENLPPVQIEIFENEEEQIEEPERRRSTRDTQVKYGYTGEAILGSILNTTQVEEIMLLVDDEATPKSYKKAVSGDNAQEWKEAIKAEYQSLLDHDTFDLVERPQNTKVIRTHHVFKIKRDEKGNISKFKARLVARGDTQIEGENFLKYSAQLYDQSRLED